MHAPAPPVKREPRQLFVAGRLRPRRDPRPCTQMSHAGPMWSGQGICARCGSHVHRDNVRRAS